MKKGQNRFKDIPIDISTKILRSNLREWGAKVKYGNMPGNSALTQCSARPRARATPTSSRRAFSDLILLTTSTLTSLHYHLSLTLSPPHTHN